MFSFDSPWVFLLLPLPLLIYRFVKPASEQQTTLVVPFYQQLMNAPAQEKSQGALKSLPLLLLLAIWLLMVIAAARPQWAGDPTNQTTSGRDLLLAVDISESMEQQDMQLEGQAVSRIAAVKNLAGEFIERRKGDRLGLVLFGSQAYLQTPLTFDRNSVKDFLIEAQLGFAGPKTAIGDAIGLSSKRLQKLSPENERVIVLLTDGANTAGEVDPLQAAVLAQQMGIKIYTIGIGADEMVVRGLFGPRRFNPSAQLDEKTLLTIADSTGGQYFRARNSQDLQKIYQEIDKLVPVEQEADFFRPTRSLFAWPLSFALITAFGWVIVYLSQRRRHFMSDTKEAKEWIS